MKSTWPDFSRRAELLLEAGVVRDVQSAAAALRIPVLVAGAFARDLHLRYGLGVDMSRRTEDIDFALSVPDWEAFAALRQALVDSGRFNAADNHGHRLVHESRLPVDIVPFGAVETADRLIHWPPAGAVEMDVFGFSEALATAQTVHLPGEIRIPVVTLPSLALLKIVAWNERHHRAPRKDALDLMLILRHYLDACDAERLWTTFAHWTEDEAFDYEHASARLLGYDLGLSLGADGRARAARLIAGHLDLALPTRLPDEMAPHQPERALALLQAMQKGLRESLHAA